MLGSLDVRQTSRAAEEPKGRQKQWSSGRGIHSRVTDATQHIRRPDTLVSARLSICELASWLTNVDAGKLSIYP